MWGRVNSSKAPVVQWGAPIVSLSRQIVAPRSAGHRRCQSQIVWQTGFWGVCSAQLLSHRPRHPPFSFVHPLTPDHIALVVDKSVSEGKHRSHRLEADRPRIWIRLGGGNWPD